MTTEQAAIQVAKAYAAANGYDPDDHRAVGLVIAGMAIASLASSRARQDIADEYARQFPDAVQAIDRWAASLNRAAR